MTIDTVRIGAAEVTMSDAHQWLGSYFDETGNRTRKDPFAYPAYDRLDTGSGPDVLNDGDLLAPTLLNAAPKIVAFFSLQRTRERLQDALSVIDAGLSLSDAVAAGTTPTLLGNLVSVLDDPAAGMQGVRLTTLTKVLHRKRPAFVPLYDQFVKACYVGRTPEHPVAYRSQVRTDVYFVDVAAAISADLDAQPEAFAELAAQVPDVSSLRLLDVLAWRAGRRRPR